MAYIKPTTFAELLNDFLSFNDNPKSGDINKVLLDTLNDIKMEID